MAGPNAMYDAVQFLKSIFIAALSMLAIIGGVVLLVRAIHEVPGLSVHLPWVSTSAW